MDNAEDGDHQNVERAHRRMESVRHRARKRLRNTHKRDDQGWSGLSVKEYKELKGLKKENLGDNMTNIELVLNMLAEVTATAISKQENPKAFEENKKVARRGGGVASDAKKRFEEETGMKTISPLNANDKPALEIKTQEEGDDNN